VGRRGSPGGESLGPGTAWKRAQLAAAAAAGDAPTAPPPSPALPPAARPARAPSRSSTASRCTTTPRRSSTSSARQTSSGEGRGGGWGWGRGGVGGWGVRRRRGHRQHHQPDRHRQVGAGRGPRLLGAKGHSGGRHAVGWPRARFEPRVAVACASPLPPLPPTDPAPRHSPPRFLAINKSHLGPIAKKTVKELGWCPKQVRRKRAQRGGRQRPRGATGQADGGMRCAPLPPPARSRPHSSRARSSRSRPT
jgi:hypothetical protein